MGLPVLVMVSLVATSNKTGCCTTTGITSLILEMVTNMRYKELSLVHQLHTGARSMPHMQMHVGSTERLHGNVVRLVHKPHPH